MTSVSVELFNINVVVVASVVVTYVSLLWCEELLQVTILNSNYTTHK